MNVYDFLLNKSNVLERLNKHVVAKGKQLDLSGNGMWRVAVGEEWGGGVGVWDWCEGVITLFPSMQFPLRRVGYCQTENWLPSVQVEYITMATNKVR